MGNNMIQNRCKREYLEKELKARFPGADIRVDSAEINMTGERKTKGDSFNKIFGVSKDVKNLPPYCEVNVTWRTGEFEEKIIIWSPLTWNGRFAGTVGGGAETGGAGYLTAPDDFTRGWTVPYAVMKGFTAATANAGNINGLHDYMLDEKTGKVKQELYENWRARTTHHMTVVGKAVAEIVHGRPVQYAYMNGGSGGGRQCMVEAQEYPEDYDGIWASCPAIHWNRFLLEGLWFLAVMNTNHHILKPAKIEYFMKRVWEESGGKDIYFSSEKKPVFDANTFVGAMSEGGKITEQDAKVMQAFWDGPKDADGNRLWYGFRPGVKFWNVGIPVGGFYYSLIRKQPKPFFLTTLYARWVTEQPKRKFEKITIPEFEALFKQSIEKFKDAGADQADLSVFQAHGGKLIVDHGLNDPLIPVDGTIDYYKNVVACMGKEKVDSFFRLYLVPGDGHGNCWNEQPGITESNGLKALMDWVENGIYPEEIEGVQVSRKKKEILKKALIRPVDCIDDWA